MSKSNKKSHLIGVLSLVFVAALVGIAAHPDRKDLLANGKKIVETIKTMWMPATTPTPLPTPEIDITSALKLTELDNNLPKPGEKKTVSVPIRLRIKNETRTVSFNQNFEPDEGWMIVNWRVRDNGRLGNTTGPHAIHVQRGSRVNSQHSITEGYKSLFDLLAELERRAGEKGDKEAQQAYNRMRLQVTNEFNAYNTSSTLFESANKGLNISASARCIWTSTPLGNIYHSGGKVDADVDIELMYIGHQGFLDTRLDRYRKALDLLKR